MTLTIDTQVLCLAEDYDNAEHEAVHELMMTIKRDGHFIAVDHEHRIEGEYWNNKNITGYAMHWLKEMFETKGPHGYRIQNVDGTVPDKHDRSLRQLGFKPNDLPFVGVASNTESKLLVAYERGYTDKVCEYLRNCQLQVRVCCAGDAEAECQACT